MLLCKVTFQQPRLNDTKYLNHNVNIFFNSFFKNKFPDKNTYVLLETSYDVRRWLSRTKKNVCFTKSAEILKKRKLSLTKLECILLLFFKLVFHIFKFSLFIIVLCSEKFIWINWWLINTSFKNITLC